jgi:hypothetical protein
MIHCVSSVERDSVRIHLNRRLAFNSVTTRVFPLKASMNQLQDFCDNYLNFADEHKRNRPNHYFKPAMPWVYCQVVNYGQMTTATQNLGWLSQHEVFFLVPLAWYTVEKGELQFKDWAMVCPFLFVDNDISLTTGREIYGWVKVRSWLDRLEPSWSDDPSLPRLLMDMRTKLYPRAYAGEPVEERSLLQITQDPPPSVFRNPFGKQDLFGPMWSIPQAIRTSLGFALDLVEYAVGLPVQGYDARSVPTTGAMIARNLLDFTRLLPLWQPDRDTVREADARVHARGRNYYLNQITLKQFRDAAEPRYACYQALVNSRIAIDHYYDGGLLGAPNVALGDLTGGIRLLLHDYPEQQVQTTLGLEVASWRESPQGHRVAVLMPRLPFWASYDLRYDNGDTLCWRTKTSDWYCDPCKQPVCEDGRANIFNSTPGGAIQAEFGPFTYPDVTVRVFPLEADPDVLLQYCNKYLNDQGSPPPPGELPTVGDNRFEPWGKYVYMLVITHSNEDSVAFAGGNNIGPIATNQIVFYLPVKWYRRDKQPSSGVFTPLTDQTKRDKLYTLGVLTPFVFGSGRQVVSEREVNGLPSTYGHVAGGPDVWLNTFQGKERSVLAELTTMLITALDAGQPAREETLIEIVSVPRRTLLELESEATSLTEILSAIVGYVSCLLHRAFYWVLSFYAWLFGVAALLRPRFIDYIVKFPMNYISLKRVRATSREAGKKVTHKFCYQALVLVEKTIEALFSVRWIEKKDWGLQRFVARIDRNIRVDIRYHESLDIASELGLLNPNIVSRPGSAPVQEFRPHHPFQIRLHLNEGVGWNVQTKIESGPWGEDFSIDLNRQYKVDFPSGPLAAALKAFAAMDGPYEMIRDYVRKFGTGGSCWQWNDP